MATGVHSAPQGSRGYADGFEDDEALAEVEVLRKVEISDDEDENELYKYEEVPEVGEDDDVSGDEDLAAALMSVAIKKHKANSPAKHKSSPKKGSRDGSEEGSEAKGLAHVRPAVLDDFIRKFLIKVGMTRTLDAFNTEWYELQSKGKLSEEYTSAVPDIYLRNQELDDSVHSMRVQLDKMKDIAHKAQGTWDKFRKERDFHRMHHKRVVIEKNRLVTDLRRLRRHFDSYEPTLVELRKKYEVAMKEKMLIRLERDRVRARADELLQQVRRLEEQRDELAEGAVSGGAHSAKGNGLANSHVITRAPGRHPSSSGNVGSSNNNSNNNNNNRRGQRESRLPLGDAPNPFGDLTFEPPPVDRYGLKKTFRGHLNSVASVVFHPRKPVFATVSDDETWKLWSLPTCDLIMSGEGHTDWLAGADFHPHGTHLATASGDQSVKLWDFATASCTATLVDHTQAVWGVAFHYSGDFLASCSMDHTTRLWDLGTQKCKTTFRGHVDSVNALSWQPCTSNLCTGSGDKTVSMWDARSGLCVQTFYGHLNAVNHVALTRKGDVVASCDADGVIKLWDVRSVSELATIETGYYPVNQVAFDRSGQRLACACDDGSVRVYDTLGKRLVSELKGHEDAVQCVAFDPSDRFLLSGGSDATFRLWS